MKLLRAKQVAEKLSVAKSYVWVLARRKGFPSPYKLGPNHTAWADAEIDLWLLTYKQGENHDQAA